MAQNGGKPRFRNRRIVFFFVLFVVWEVLLYLDRHDFINIPGELLRASTFIVSSLIVLLVTSIVIRMTVKRVFNLFKADAELEERLFFTKIYTVVLYFLAITVIMALNGVSLGNITIFLGIVTAGLSFALQAPILSLVSWMVLLTKNPFRIGDYITVGGEEGKVVHIGTFYVTLEMESKKLIKIPNRIFLEKTIFNFGSKGIKETIAIPLSKLPKDALARMAKMESATKKLISSKEDVMVSIGTEKGLSFIVTYFVPMNERKATRNKVATALYQMNDNMMKR